MFVYGYEKIKNFKKKRKKKICAGLQVSLNLFVQLSEYLDMNTATSALHVMCVTFLAVDFLSLSRSATLA